MRNVPNHAQCAWVYSRNLYVHRMGMQHACMNAQLGCESTCTQNIRQTLLCTETYEGHELRGY